MGQFRSRCDERPAPGRPYWIAVLWLVGCVGAVGTLLWPVAFMMGGVWALVAAVVASVVCLVAGGASLAVTSRLIKAGHGVAAPLGGMAVRLVFPLMFLVMVYADGGRLAEAGIVFYILAFYLVTLAVDTWLTLPSSSGALPSRSEGSKVHGGPA